MDEKIRLTGHFGRFAASPALRAGRIFFPFRNGLSRM